MTAVIEDASSETSALIAKDGSVLSKRDADKYIDDSRRNEPFQAEAVPTNWHTEAKTLANYSIRLIITFVLQMSLNVVSIIIVGHLGKIELGAASLASVTANITGYAVYRGLGIPRLNPIQQRIIC